MSRAAVDDTADERARRKAQKDKERRWRIKYIFAQAIGVAISNVLYASENHEFVSKSLTVLGVNSLDRVASTFTTMLQESIDPKNLIPSQPPAKTDEEEKKRPTNTRRSSAANSGAAPAVPVAVAPPASRAPPVAASSALADEDDDDSDEAYRAFLKKIEAFQLRTKRQQGPTTTQTQTQTQTQSSNMDVQNEENSSSSSRARQNRQPSQPAEFRIGTPSEAEVMVAGSVSLAGQSVSLPSELVEVFGSSHISGASGAILSLTSSDVPGASMVAAPAGESVVPDSLFDDMPALSMVLDDLGSLQEQGLL